MDGKGHVYVLGRDWDDKRGIGKDGHGLVLIQYDRNLKRNWIRRYYDEKGGAACGNAMALDAAGAAVFGSVYITGTTYGIGQPFSQGLLQVREDGTLFGFTPFAGASRGDQHGNSMTTDHRRMLHITGQGHFTDTENASPHLDSTEIVTTTYDLNGGLYRVHRYAGSDLLRSMGGRVVAVDEQDNILVAGQTFDGKFNDIVLLKYPP